MLLVIRNIRCCGAVPSSIDQYFAACAYRYNHNPDNGNYDFGLRLVLSAPIASLTSGDLNSERLYEPSVALGVKPPSKGVCGILHALRAAESIFAVFCAAVTRRGSGSGWGSGRSWMGWLSKICPRKPQVSA